MEDLKIKINDNEYEFSFDKKFPDEVYRNDKEYTVKLLKDYGNGILAYSINNRNLLVEINRDNGGYKILHNNFRYEATVKTATTAILEQYMLTNNEDEQHSILKAPMPGMVIKLLCNVGDEVEKGDNLIIVEAMKMENTLTSPSTGKIKSIKAKEGTAVDKEEILIELETE